ncbi:MAG: enoyl-CoA hydratase-related protein [Bacteroidota bacterium]|nr:enoyl-CoA hydratase-related protein [Bacteroidota bacterium]
MQNSCLVCEEKDNILIIKLNRPDKLNALNVSILKELNSVLDNYAENKNIKVILITGSGEKAFAAGADIDEISKLTIIDAKSFSEYGQGVFHKIENFSKPVIALINGYAFGGGFELALACHIRLCSENAKMGLPELNLGLIPGYGGTQRLPRKINSGRALYYILSGEQMDSAEAYRMGIVSNVYSSMNLFENGLELAKRIAEKSVDAVAFSLKAVISSENTTMSEGLSIESSLFSLCIGTENFIEGTSAFNEKRKPVFNKSNKE